MPQIEHVHRISIDGGPAEPGFLIATVDGAIRGWHGETKGTIWHEPGHTVTIRAGFDNTVTGTAYIMSCMLMEGVCLTRFIGEGPLQPGRVETPDITIRVSREVLGELSEWSKPVQIRFIKHDNGEWDMEVRETNDR